MSNPTPPVVPQPVQPLIYSTPQPARPGIITAIGIMSIVVACISGLATLSMGFWLVGIFFASQAMQTINTAATTTAPATADTSSATTTTIDTAAPRGLTPEQRQIALHGFEQARPLTEPRRQRLDALLATHGRDMFLISPNNLTPDLVRQSISRSGTAGADDDIDYFILGAGRVELTDSEARYIPLDGGRTLTVTTAPPDPSPRYSPEQVEAVIERVQNELDAIDPNQAAALSPEQIEALRAAIEDPESRLFDPSGRTPLENQVISVILMHDGTLWIMTMESDLKITPDGQVTTGATMAGAFAFFNISTTAMALAAVEAVGSMALAVYLLVIGIMVLRQHPSSGKLHMIYAMLKLPLAIVAGIAWAWIFMGFMSGPAFGAAMAGPAMIFGAVVGVLAAAYPVGLLIALRSHSVRMYYLTARQ